MNAVDRSGKWTAVHTEKPQTHQLMMGTQMKQMGSLSSTTGIYPGLNCLKMLIEH